MREADLCMVLGNLLENALRASERLPEAMRRVSVICHMLSPAMMGLIVENRYDGQLSRREGKLLSTSHPGFGTGLLSVETVSEKVPRADDRRDGKRHVPGECAAESVAIRFPN